jgi:plastocyanin
MPGLSLLLSWLLIVSWMPVVSAQDYGTRAPGKSPVQLAATTSTQKEFYIVTVHIDGKTNINGDKNHPAEPFPTPALPAGGGLIKKEPDNQGDWSIRAFVFQPSQLIVQQGDKVTLHFVGVHGPSHTIAIEGHPEQLTVRRGEMQTVSLVANTVGTIRFTAMNRQPTMQGQIVVLPRE